MPEGMKGGTGATVGQCCHGGHTQQDHRKMHRLLNNINASRLESSKVSSSTAGCHIMRQATPQQPLCEISAGAAGWGQQGGGKVRWQGG